MLQQALSSAKVDEERVLAREDKSMRYLEIENFQINLWWWGIAIVVF